MKEITCYHSTCLSPLEDKGGYFYACHSCGQEIYNSNESICNICGSPMLLNENNVAICSNPYCPAYSFALCSVCKPFYNTQTGKMELNYRLQKPLNCPEDYQGAGCLQIRAIYDKRKTVCLDLTKANFSVISKNFIHNLHKQWIRQTIHQPRYLKPAQTRKRYAAHGSY